MVQAIIDLGDHEARVLTIVKGKYGLSNKSDAVNLVIQRYEEEILEPHLKPVYKKELLRVDKGKFKRFSNVKGLRDEIVGTK